MPACLRHLCVFLALAGLGIAQTLSPPPTIVLPDNLATTATGKTVAGTSWLYLVIQPSNPSATQGKAFRVHLKSGGFASPNPFAPLGLIRPTTDPATIGVLLSRAYTLGDAPATIESITNGLIDQWRTPGQSIAGPLESRIGQLIHRAAESEKDAATLRHLSLAHPAFRLPMGLAWGGPIPTAPGTLCTVEVREIDASGADIAVVGRCEFTAGQPPNLVAPAAPIQVPDLSPEGDLLVKLRWAVPTALRRQSLQTTGFRLWRVPAATSLPNPPTLAQLLAAPGVKQVTLAPILLSKLFTSGNPAAATDAANFTQDATTFFAADDNDRDATTAIVPTPATPPFVQRTGTPHPENTSYQYFVAALDWLKQPGLISPAGTGIAVRTLPPPVPQNLSVEEIHQGGTTTNVRFRLSFDSNRNTTPNISTQRYAIYRGGSDAQSLEKRSYLLPDTELPRPDGEPGLAALTTLTHAPGRLSHTDAALAAAGNETQTFWYSVRAIHDTPLGPVYSAPSPPVFGTFHDFRGPNAPTGTTISDTQRALCREDSNLYVIAENLPAGSVVPAKGRIIRLVARRIDDQVTRVQFLVIDPRTQNQGTGPILVFAPGENEVHYDALWPDPAANPGQPTELIFAAASQSRGGSTSYIAWKRMIWGGAISASTTQRTRIGFECAARPTSALNSTDALTAKMLQTPGAFTTQASGSTVRATLGTTAFNGQTAVITLTRLGQPTRTVLSTVVSNTITFADPGLVPGALAVAYSIRLVRPYQNHAPGNETFADLPPAWPASVLWPPIPTTFPHLSSLTTPTSLSISLKLTPDSKEYRVFRQVDGGELSLISEGIADYDTNALQEVLVADQPNLPVSGRVCYFGQLVDRHGNTSPLKQIGPCIDIIGPTPVPVLNDPKPAGTSAAPKMALDWFCPPQGVRRFRIRIVDLTSGTTVVTSPNAVQLPVDPSQPVYFNPSPAGTEPVSLPQGSSFATHLNAPLSGAGQPPPSPDHNAEFDVQLDHEYQVEIEAEGINPLDLQRSLPRTFTWRAPIAAGTVAWPARPLPRVVDGAPYNIVARELISTNPYFAQAFASPIQLFDADQTPVIIPIGVMPITAYTSSRLTPEPSIQAGAYPLLTANPASPLYRGSIDPNAHLIPVFSATSASKTQPVLPVVLYRQIVAAQGLDTTNTGDLVQASPLISSIAWRNEGGNIGVVDPLIVTLPSYLAPSQTYTAASFWLPDTRPVIAGHTYRYFLVRFDDQFEIEQVIDCGTVTISP